MPILLTLEHSLFKSFLFVLCVLLSSTLPNANANTVACPDLKTAMQVGACPTEEQLKHTFIGFCSDDPRAYRTRAQRQLDAEVANAQCN